MRQYKITELFRGHEPIHQSDFVAVRFSKIDRYLILKIRTKPETRDLSAGGVIDKDRYNKIITLYDAPIILNSEYINCEDQMIAPFINENINFISNVSSILNIEQPIVDSLDIGEENDKSVMEMLKGASERMLSSDRHECKITDFKYLPYLGRHVYKICHNLVSEEELHKMCELVNVNIRGLNE